MATEILAPATLINDPFDSLRLDLRREEADRQRRGCLATALGVGVIVAASMLYGSAQAVGIVSVIGSAVVTTLR